jgi:hypothetical protein
MDMFEDLCSELKTMYGGVSSLCMGVSELDTSFDDPSPDNMVVQIFETICDSDDGTITRSDLSAAFNLFDETSLDPSFAERCMHDLLPQHLVSLDFRTFSDFLTKFLNSLFLSKLEPFISNQALFVSIGGRDLTAVIHEERLKEHALGAANEKLNDDLAKTRRELNAAKREMELLRTRLAQLVEQNLSNKLQEMNGEEEQQHRRLARNSATKLFRSATHTRPKPRGSLTASSPRGGGKGEGGPSNRIDRKSPPPSPGVGGRGFARSVRRTSQSVDSVVSKKVPTTPSKGSSSSSSSSEQVMEITTTTTSSSTSSSSKSGETSKEVSTSSSSSSSSGEKSSSSSSASSSSGKTNEDGDEVKEVDMKETSKKGQHSESSSSSSSGGGGARPQPIRKGGLKKSASKKLDNRTYSLNSIVDDNDDDNEDASSVYSDDNASVSSSQNGGGGKGDDASVDDRGGRNSINSSYFRNAVRSSIGSESSGDSGLDEMLVEQVMASEDPLGSFLTMIDLVQFRPALEKHGANMLVQLLDIDIIGAAQLKKSGFSDGNNNSIHMLKYIYIYAHDRNNRHISAPTLLNMCIRTPSCS